MIIMSEDQNYNRGIRGVDVVKGYLKSKGIEFKDVQNERGTHWDLEIMLPTGEKKCIEVKTTKQNFAIPDMSGSQIEYRGGIFKLLADELWVVVKIQDKPEIYKLTREDIRKLGEEGAIKEKTYWDITDKEARKLKNQ